MFDDFITLDMHYMAPNVLGETSVLKPHNSVKLLSWMMRLYFFPGAQTAQVDLGNLRSSKEIQPY